MSGKPKYLFAPMNNDTRFGLAKDMADTKFQHNADYLLKLTKLITGNKTPKYFITDGLPS